ncbi:hypothetical protein [Agromyces soli]|uniref:Secreted protein n=1 Tax=Agromyces soli TaxID=659012 RepID=A0ABY4AWF9_9MICO|nr:hypothetical protein [Agromyces soli]UOE27537.1 hypothetical protein MTP13_07095 [Agromyces soli]
MNQILGFLVTHLSWIWSDARYRIAGFQVSTSNGGDALLVIESATLRMQLIRDRGYCSSISSPPMMTRSGIRSRSCAGCCSGVGRRQQCSTPAMHGFSKSIFLKSKNASAETCAKRLSGRGW